VNPFSFGLFSLQVPDPFPISTFLPFWSNGLDEQASSTLPPYDGSPYILLCILASKASLLHIEYVFNFDDEFMFNGINF
jgi:hypothetical protein